MAGIITENDIKFNWKWGAVYKVCNVCFGLWRKGASRVFGRRLNAGLSTLFYRITAAF